MSRLFDPMRKDGTFPFNYRNSANTDVRETFRKARERQAQQQPSTVSSIKPRVRSK